MTRHTDKMDYTLKANLNIIRLRKRIECLPDYQSLDAATIAERLTLQAARYQARISATLMLMHPSFIDRVLKNEVGGKNPTLVAGLLRRIRKIPNYKTLNTNQITAILNREVKEARQRVKTKQPAGPKPVDPNDVKRALSLPAEGLSLDYSPESSVPLLNLVIGERNFQFSPANRIGLVDFELLLNRSGLVERDRNIGMLSIANNFSTAEIAEQLGVSESTVNLRIGVIKEKIRKAFYRDEDQLAELLPVPLRFNKTAERAAPSIENHPTPEILADTRVAEVESPETSRAEELQLPDQWLTTKVLPKKRKEQAGLEAFNNAFSLALAYSQAASRTDKETFLAQQGINYDVFYGRVIGYILNIQKHLATQPSDEQLCGFLAEQNVHVEPAALGFEKNEGKWTHPLEKINFKIRRRKATVAPLLQDIFGSISYRQIEKDDPQQAEKIKNQARQLIARKEFSTTAIASHLGIHPETISAWDEEDEKRAKQKQTDISKLAYKDITEPQVLFLYITRQAIRLQAGTTRQQLLEDIGISNKTFCLRFMSLIVELQEHLKKNRGDNELKEFLKTKNIHAEFKDLDFILQEDGWHHPTESLHFKNQAKQQSAQAELDAQLPQTNYHELDTEQALAIRRRACLLAASFSKNKIAAQLGVTTDTVISWVKNQQPSRNA